MRKDALLVEGEIRGCREYYRQRHAHAQKRDAGLLAGNEKKQRQVERIERGAVGEPYPRQKESGNKQQRAEPEPKFRFFVKRIGAFARAFGVIEKFFNKFGILGRGRGGVWLRIGGGWWRVRGRLILRTRRGVDVGNATE